MSAAAVYEDPAVATEELVDWLSPQQGPNPADSWLDQVALEMRVDVERSPAVVALAGTLDADTAASVRSVVSQLVAEGHRNLVVDLSRLSIAGDLGLDALIGIQAAAQRVGGSVTWSFRPNEGPS